MEFKARKVDKKVSNTRLMELWMASLRQAAKLKEMADVAEKLADDIERHEQMLKQGRAAK